MLREKVDLQESTENEEVFESSMSRFFRLGRASRVFISRRQLGLKLVRIMRSIL